MTPVVHPGDGVPGGRPRYDYPRRRRVTRGRELDVLRREGKRVRTEHLDVRVLASLPAFPASPSDAAPTALDRAPRVGIIVPKHKRSGVERNQLKRRLRELARLRLLPALPPPSGAAGGPGGAAVLLRARPEAYGAAFDALARDVERAAREAARWLSAAPPAPKAPPPGITPA